MIIFQAAARELESFLDDFRTQSALTTLANSLPDSSIFYISFVMARCGPAPLAPRWCPAGALLAPRWRRVLVPFSALFQAGRAFPLPGRQPCHV